MERFLKAFVEVNAKYKELFTLLYSALGGLVGIILYRERIKFKAGADAAKVASNEKRIESLSEKVETLEDKVAAMNSSMIACQKNRSSLMAPVEARIDEMEKRLVYMLEADRKAAKREKIHDLDMLMAKIEGMVKR